VRRDAPSDDASTQSFDGDEEVIERVGAPRASGEHQVDGIRAARHARKGLGDRVDIIGDIADRAHR
jgi:hypothetical protein